MAIKKRDQNKSPATNKKTPQGNASTARSKRMLDEIKQAGGARVVVNFKSKDELQPLDDLVAWGEGADRNDVIRKLVRARHAVLSKKDL